MYNNLLRKITSLSLLTILLTSTAAFVLPTAMPAAHAQVASHPNLFVSAENSQWNNYFAGPQVVQVVVSDPNIQRLDQTYGEPIVTINGKRLRMAQGTDGNWYGYFADRNQAIAASKTSGLNGTGLNFGLFCSSASTLTPKGGVDYTQTKGFTIARDVNATGTGIGSLNATTLTSGGSNLPTCVTPTIATSAVGAFAKIIGSPGRGEGIQNITKNSAVVKVTTIQHVIRENKTLNTNGVNPAGSGFAALPLYTAIWPVIQLYDFSAIPTPVAVDYQRTGGDQIVNLTFDRIPSNLISVTADRTAYPENTQVFLTMNDPQLNIDPTEEDSWTWGANATTGIQLFYQAFDRNGNPDADGSHTTAGALLRGEPHSGMQNLVGNLTTFMFNHNGKFQFNPQAQNVRIVDFQGNGKQQLNGSATLAPGNPAHQTTTNMTTNSAPITFIEVGGVNTGVFGNWDGGKKANVVTLTPNEETQAVGASIRGQSATFRYNDIAGSIVGGFQFGSITMTATNGTWQGGTRIPVTLTDADSNKNSMITEHLNNWDPKYDRIATMKIGTPFSLNSANPTLGTGPESAIIFANSTHDNTGKSGVVRIFSSAGGSGGAACTVNALCNGNFTITFSPNTGGAIGDAAYATSSNIAVDELFSNRPVFKFTNATLSTSHPSTFPVAIQNNGGIFVDLNTTARTLFNTINDPTNGTISNKFKGFNFLNYDFRSFSTLAGANNTATNATVYLVYSYTATHGLINPASSLPASITTGSAGTTYFGVSLANSTNLIDFINLNKTFINFATGKTINNPAASQYATLNQGGIALIHSLKERIDPKANIGLLVTFGIPSTTHQLALNTNGTAKIAIAADFFSVGIVGDGQTNTQRINNGVYRWELEETGNNSGVFTGTNQFLMLNQLNIFDPQTYSQLRTINHDVLFLAIQDMLASEARAPQITYFDLGADGVNTQVSAQKDIPTHTGVVSFDQKTYKIADTVTITVNDQDLNTNTDLVVIYTAVTPQQTLAKQTASAVDDVATDTIGKLNNLAYTDGRAFSRLLDVQFGQKDIRWSNDNTAANANTKACFNEGNSVTPFGEASSFSATGFSLVETAAGSGIFKGTFQIPDQLCQNSATGVPVSSVGQNIKVNYVDFRDESGKLIEVSDNAGIRGNTGSVKLDKAVYPVPFATVVATGQTGDFATDTTITSENGVFPMHRDTTGTSGTAGTSGGIKGLSNLNTLSHGDVLVHARVNDPDYSIAGTGTSFIGTSVFNNDHGPVAFQISRQGASVLLATAGGPAAIGGKILNLNGTALKPINDNSWSQVRDLGPMTEITPGAGIFQADLPIRFTDGPQGTDCPTAANFDGGINGTGFGAEKVRFYTTHDKTSAGTSGGNYCVRQGDVLTVTYRDTSDASGSPQTVTDSATFDLRNGVLQSDKSVYIIGSDMILTLVEPDLNLDSQQAETIPLDVVEWDSHAFKGTMGPLGGQTAAFDAKPSTFVETGKDTGIFQAVIKVPKTLGSNLLERGEQIHLEYTDWGPAGAKTVGANNQDIELTIYTSNFGATVELDQKVYTWTDRVYITVVAPDHNFDPNLIDTIGDNDENKVTVSTRGHQISYKLTESGVDTGIFTGYVILTGDSTIKGSGGVDGTGTEPRSVTGNGATNSCTSPSNACGPTDGFLQSEESDGVSVAFEFTRDQTVTGSALIRWNIGEVKWLQPSYPANGQGVLQIVDPDMNLDPKAIDKFDTNVWSDSDSGGIKLTMTETGQDTGIFQGTVYFTTNFQSSGNRLHVAEGDTVTGEYKDRTLPPPYTPADQLRLTATTFIGTIVPPLERAPASNPRIVDSFGNAITGAVKVGQQIQVTADLSNGQDRDQPFAYLVQIQDASGVTVSLSWITGTLTAGQSLNPAQSWTSSAAGTYNAQIFVWQSIDNPNALSPPLSTTITVQ